MAQKQEMVLFHMSQAEPFNSPGANEPCWCGSGTKYKKCHRSSDEAARRQTTVPRVKPGTLSPMRTVPAHIPRPDYFETGVPGPGVLGDSSTRLARIRAAASSVAKILKKLGSDLRPGLTTDEIDARCHQLYIEDGGFPSTLNYRNFPKSLCTSVNEVVLHGIPDSRPLQDGDIVNLDISIYLNGVHGDCSATFGVGAVDEASKKLLKVTEDSLMKGIEAVKPGQPLRLVGRAIEQYAKKYGYAVVREFCGHGIGELFHCHPQVTHYEDPDDETVMEEGMVFTIEPMLLSGSPQLLQWNDGWTIVAADGKRSAQFEHTVLVTSFGAEILTVTQ